MLSHSACLQLPVHQRFCPVAQCMRAALQTPYLQFISQLLRIFSTRPMVLVECRHVSITLCSRAIQPDAVVAAMVEIMRRHGWASAAFAGHSCATFAASLLYVVSQLCQLCAAAACNVPKNHDLVGSGQGCAAMSPA